MSLLLLLRSQQAGGAQEVSITETSVSTDSSSVLKTTISTINENANIVETQTSQLITQSNISETSNISDTENATVIFSKNISELLNALNNTVVTKISSVNITELQNITETNHVQLITNSELIEDNTANDLLNLEKITLTEVIELNEILDESNSSVITNAFLTELLDLTDTTDYISQGRVTVIEESSIIDLSEADILYVKPEINQKNNLVNDNYNRIFVNYQKKKKEKLDKILIDDSEITAIVEFTLKHFII